MGSFDCYCAICCGPLGLGFIRLGSSKPRPLARRKKRVENKAKRLKGEDVLNEDSKEWKDIEKEEDEQAREEEDKEMEDADATKEHALEGEDGNRDEVIDDAAIEDAPWDEDVSDEGQQDETSDHESEHENDGNSEAESDGSGYEDENAHEEDDADYSDNASQASELSLPRDFDMARESKDDTNSMFSYYEKHAYDPTKISQEDVQWIDRARVLAINKEWRGEKKAFLSGRGRYSDLVRLHSHPFIF